MRFGAVVTSLFYHFRSSSGAFHTPVVQSSSGSYASTALRTQFSTFTRLRSAILKPAEKRQRQQTKTVKAILPEHASIVAN